MKRFILLLVVTLFCTTYVFASKKETYITGVDINSNLNYFEQQFGSKIRKNGSVFEEKFRANIGQLYQKYLKKYNTEPSKINEDNMIYVADLVTYLESYFQNNGSNRYADRFVRNNYTKKFPDLSYKILKYLNYDILVINLFGLHTDGSTMTTGSSFNHGINCGDYRGPTCLMYVFSGDREIFNNVNKKQSGFHDANVTSYVDSKNTIFYIPFSFIRFTYVNQKPGLSFGSEYVSQGYGLRTKIHMILGDNSILIGSGYFGSGTGYMSNLYHTNLNFSNPNLVFTGDIGSGRGHGIEYLHSKLLQKK